MDNFNFNRDFFDGCAALGDKDGAALAWALLKYGYTGEEPDGLKPALVAAFNFARGRVDAMRNGAQGGKSRKTVKVPKASRSKSKAPTEDPSLPPSQDPTEEPSGQKEKEIEIKKEVANATSKEAPAPCQVHGDSAAPEPSAPTLDEARTYFAANCLKGDPSEFFDHFEAQGWVRSNGQAIADWKAQARQWSRKQAEFDQSKPADLRAPDKPMPKAENAVDWEAELARLEADGWSA